MQDRWCDLYCHELFCLSSFLAIVLTSAFSNALFNGGGGGSGGGGSGGDSDDVDDAGICW